MRVKGIFTAGNPFRYLIAGPRQPRGVLAQLGERQTEAFSDLKVAGSIPAGPTLTYVGDRS